MTSLRQINASRANGARSRGPITPEGKERSSINALRHGLLAECLILRNESRECFDDLVTQHTRRFAPADGVEFAMIEEMVAANWRMRRAWAIENRLMEKAIRNQPPGDEASRIADAFSELAASPELSLLHRYETRLHRIYQRALNNLVMLGESDLPELPNEIGWPGNLATPVDENGAGTILPKEPSPISGHLGSVGQKVFSEEPSPISGHLEGVGPEPQLEPTDTTYTVSQTNPISPETPAPAPGPQPLAPGPRPPDPPTASRLAKSRGYQIIQLS